MFIKKYLIIFINKYFINKYFIKIIYHISCCYSRTKNSSFELSAGIEHGWNRIWKTIKNINWKLHIKF